MRLKFKKKMADKLPFRQWLLTHRLFNLTFFIAKRCTRQTHSKTSPLLTAKV